MGRFKHFARHVAWLALLAIASPGFVPHLADDDPACAPSIVRHDESVVYSVHF